MWERWWHTHKKGRLYRKWSSQIFICLQFHLFDVTDALTKKWIRGGKGYLDSSSRSLPITKGSQDRNSVSMEAQSMGDQCLLACLLAYSLLFFLTQTRTTCLGSGATHSRPVPPPSGMNQYHPSLNIPQANLIWAVSQLRFSGDFRWCWVDS